MTNLFISYSHQDQFWVDRFANELRKQGLIPWLDRKSLQAAQNWNDEIEAGIAASDYVLVVVSRHSAASDYVLKEIKYALQKARRLVPIIIDEGKRRNETLNQLNYRLNDTGFKLSDSQGDNFSNTYIEPFTKLIADLGGNPNEDQRWDIVSQLAKPFPKLSDLGDQWLFRLTPSPKYKDIALLIDRTGYGAEAFYVAPNDKPFEPAQPLSIFLHFAGDKTADPFRECLDYLHSHLNERPQHQILLIRGPLRKTSKGGEIYDLPIEEMADDQPGVWARAEAFIWRMVGKVIEANGGGKYLEFFLSNPNALTMMIAASLKNNYKYDVYHYLEGEVDAKRYYHRVYSSTRF